MTRRSGLILPIVLAACVAPRAPTPPPPASAPRPVPARVAAPAPLDWQDRAYTPGDWSFAGGEISYGAPGTPRLTLTCDRRSAQMRLNMIGVETGPITVRTTYGAAVRLTQPSELGLALDLPARDPLLDQIAYSRGRFMVAAGGEELILPAWPEVARVVEDCR